MEYLSKDRVIGMIEELIDTLNEIIVLDDAVTREQDLMAIAYLELISKIFSTMKPDKVD